MIETIISNIDLLSFLIFLSATILLILKFKKSVIHTPFNFLLIFLLLFTLISLSNFLQHSSIYKSLDPYEDYLSIIALIFFGFFLYMIYIRTQIKEIKETNELFKTLVEDIPGIVYIVKIEKNYPILFISPQVEQISGYKPEEFYKNPTLWDSKIIEKDREIILKEYNKIAQSRETTSIEYRIRLKDNKIHWFKDELRYFVMNDNPCIIGVSIDITNIKEFNKKLNETNKELDKRLSSLEIINRLSENLIKYSTPEEIMKESVETMRDFFGKPKIAIFKVDEKEEFLNLIYSLGFKAETVSAGRKISLHNSLNGIAFEKKEVIIFEDLEKSETIAPHIKKELLKENVKTMVLAPLLAKNRCIGVIDFLYPHKIHLDKIDKKTLESIGKTIALALEDAFNLEKIIESEERYRTLAETAEDIILIHDKKLLIKYINKAGLKLFGFTPKETIGKNLLHFLSEKERKRLLERSSKREKGDYSSFKYTAEAINKKGEIINLEVITTPLLKDGKIYSYLIIGRDIRERIEYEKSLRTLSSVVEQTTSSVIITDTDGNIEYVNPTFEKITGYGFNEVKGENPRILKSGEHSEEFYKNMWDTISSGNVWHGLLINRKKDGTLFYEDSSIFPIKDDSGNILHFAAVKRDVTKEKLYENQVRQMQRLDAIGSLTTGIAHDFNNILTSILGYSDILSKDLKNQDKLLKKVISIKNAGNKAKDLVSKLLAYSRKQVIKPKKLNLNSIIEELKDMLKRLISEDIELIFDLNEDINYIYADKSQIEQILINLIVNSKDAILESKKREKSIIIETDEVKIDTEYTETHLGSSIGEFVLLKVSDTGIGMPEEVKNKIFEPFFTTKPAGKGTGLGLSTVYGIVKQNKGFVYVYSEVNTGTTIKIYWPVYKGENKIDYGDSKTEIININDLKFQGDCLIVEDDIDVRKIAYEFLSFFGFKVYEASNGMEGIKIMKKLKDLKLILSDVVMPKMDGFEFYNEAIKIKKDIKFIFSSGYPLTHPEISKKINGDVAFLQKPFTMNDLALKLKKLFN